MCFWEILLRTSVLRSNPSILCCSFSCVSLSAVHLGFMVIGEISFVIFVSFVANPDDSLVFISIKLQWKRAKPFSDECEIAARKRKEFTQELGTSKFRMSRNATNEGVQLYTSLSNKFNGELIQDAFHMLF